MLFYPEEIERRLEVDQIRDILKGYCQTDSARSRFEKAKPIIKEDLLKVFLTQTREMIDLLASGEGLPSRSFEDFQPLFKKIRAQGTFLEGEDFRLLSSSLKSLYEWSQIIKKKGDVLPNLLKLTYGFVSDLSLVEEIESKIDERGDVRDDASPELVTIRNKIYKSEGKVRKAIQKVLERSKKDEFTEEDGAVTIRNGRLVIPIKAEFKRKVSGFIHDESATGQTAFMEPSEVLDLNNEVRELHYAQRREVIRILTEISDQIRYSLSDLERGADFLIKIDFVLAKAQFARDYESIVPTLDSKRDLELVGAYHPLLWKKHTKEGKEIVPLSIKFDREESRIVLISGPNTGGKSVALKTVGLLQYMFQCGFPVPVDESSNFVLFRNLFVDIGDSQSLENDLSTYSSHLTAMKYFLEFCDKKSLFLIDEFGTGTEPQFGGAIAEAILNRLVDSRSHGVITTHYTNLKEYTEKKRGIVNASMKYNAEALKPLFELEIGKPGSSFAFEIARKIGIDPKVLENARKKIGTKQVKYDELLTELEKERSSLEAGRNKTEKEKKELSQLRKDYESVKKLVESEKKQIIRDAKAEASRIVKDANKAVERTIREIKEGKAEKAITRQAREKLKEYDKKLEPEVVKSRPSIKPQQPEEIKVGDKVRLKGQDTVGEVLQVKTKQAEVVFGELKSFVSLGKLERISNREAKKAITKRFQGLDMDSRMVNFSRELDVRGKRAEEVFPVLDRLMDDALLLGIKDLKILHGKGQGVLKDLIRTHLKEYPNVTSMQDEHADRGGSGITLVTLG